MAQTFGQAAQTALHQATANSQSQKGGHCSDSDNMTAFFDAYDTWTVLFAHRASGSVEDEKLRAVHYYESLKHLSPAGFAKLTEVLREHCTFFPSIAECLKHTRPADRYDYGHPFHGAERSGLFIASQPDVRRLASDERKLLA